MNYKMIKEIDEVKADKEIGGDKFDESVEMSRRVIDRFGGEDLKSVLESDEVDGRL